MTLVCIPEVLTHLLTLILTYLYMKCLRWHMRQIWHFCHFWHKWRIWHPLFLMPKYGNIGVKRSVRASGMLTNAVKQLLNRFNSLKCRNSDFQNFPLYFFKFPLYNVWCLSKVDMHHQTFLFAFPSSMWSIFSKN